MLNPEQSKILTLLCTCQADNIALAETLAKGLNINIIALLEQEGFFELGIMDTSCFSGNLLHGHFDRCVISSLRAITYFPNLRRLNVSGNQLLSLAGLENCIRIKSLSCSNNQLSSLLELKNLTELEYLYCSDNQLISLSGLENCTQLKSLTCGNNQLTDLSPVYRLPDLTDLYISDNPNLTATEIARFCQHQPNCEIIC
jgi:Leucine-rich repeat (LRR) protein